MLKGYCCRFILVTRGVIMFKSIKAILFATNLSETCKQAFEFAAVLATRFQATIVILHVLEKVPKSAQGMLKAYIGDDRWNETAASQEKDARQILDGMKSSVALVHEALCQFCTEAGIDAASCGYASREIVISEGEIVDNVIATAEKYHCDIIILGTREGFLFNNVIGPTIKAIMRKSKIPVLVVPPKA
jgi:nucleotide-binding universal stress UspA family protein